MRAPLRAAIAAAVVVAVSVGHAAQAAADPPVPTDFRSTVDAIDPAADGVRAEIVGGDAFLELSVGEGHEVVVEGYQGEPYVRFRPDGTVERNLRSPATYVNESRDGAVDLPDGVDAETAETAEPDWQTVADGGTYAWHDHRVHWMGGERPEGAEPGDWTRPWAVDVVVDGTETRINGTLALAEGVSPLPWAALALAAGAAAALVGRRRPVVTAASAALVAGALALPVGWAEYDATPAGAGANRLLVVVPVVGLVAAALGLGFRAAVSGHRRTPRRMPAGASDRGRDGRHDGDARRRRGGGGLVRAAPGGAVATRAADRADIRPRPRGHRRGAGARGGRRGPGGSGPVGAGRDPGRRHRRRGRSAMTAAAAGS